MINQQGFNNEPGNIKQLAESLGPQKESWWALAKVLFELATLVASFIFLILAGYYMIRGNHVESAYYGFWALLSKSTLNRSTIEDMLARWRR